MSGTATATGVPVAAAKASFSFAPAATVTTTEAPPKEENEKSTNGAQSKNLFGQGNKIFSATSGGSFAGVSLDSKAA